MPFETTKRVPLPMGGSYKNGKGTAGMTIHPGKTVTNKLSVLNWSPGTAEEQQPY